ncbi:hypothetical protein [Devosia sp.]|jgi:hypothetical protein|uniref:hypothetical protein n=1 Tax=Devosia sp. TaxID=1871048 RepID=UPI001AC37962|nr:hypothetical protein [Devosia sp.]MBN9334417.1 hypothetical protein [Devosia sp.]
MKFLPLLFSLLLVSPAAAEMADPSSAVTLRGKCQSLTAGAEDLGNICASEIMQVIYTDHHMELVVWTDDPSGRFIVFSGEMEQGPDAKSFQHVDLVIAAPDGSGDRNVTYKAKGLCTFGDYRAGNAQYRCEAVTKDGSVYNFAFLTDAGAPENMLD